VYDILTIDGVYTRENTITPTDETYGPLQAAYQHFNRELFGNRLPSCLITLQRHANTKGCFSPNRFTALKGEARTDELALNPEHFRVDTPQDICSTLVHEMVHLAQQHFGKPGRKGYHNGQWAATMCAIGLQPRSKNGKGTGYHVDHDIVPDGPFSESYRRFEAAGLIVGWGDAFTHSDDGPPKPKRLKFVCPSCGANVLGKPSTDVSCNPCGQVMVAAHD
jgi:ribosomal protein S27E